MGNHAKRVGADMSRFDHETVGNGLVQKSETKYCWNPVMLRSQVDRLYLKTKSNAVNIQNMQKVDLSLPPLHSLLPAILPARTIHAALRLHDIVSIKH